MISSEFTTYLCHFTYDFVSFNHKMKLLMLCFVSILSGELQKMFWKVKEFKLSKKGNYFTEVNVGSLALARRRPENRTRHVEQESPQQ